MPPDLMFPSMSNEGLWGGEGIIVGLRKKKKTSPRYVVYLAMLYSLPVLHQQCHTWHHKSTMEAGYHALG